MRGARTAPLTAALIPAVLLGAGAGPGLSAAVQAVPTAPRTHVLVVTGLGGAPEYSEQFRTEAESLLDALDSRLGVRETVAWLAEDEALSPRVSGRATLEAIEREVLAMANRAGPSDVALILLLGHGSGAGRGIALQPARPRPVGGDALDVAPRVPDPDRGRGERGKRQRRVRTRGGR